MRIGLLIDQKTRQALGQTEQRIKEYAAAGEEIERKKQERNRHARQFNKAGVRILH